MGQTRSVKEPARFRGGKLIGCFGLTEADSGSDPAVMKTTATKTTYRYTLNGAKIWISKSLIADGGISTAVGNDVQFERLGNVLIGRGFASNRGMDETCARLPVGMVTNGAISSTARHRQCLGEYFVNRITCFYS